MIFQFFYLKQDLGCKYKVVRLRTNDEENFLGEANNIILYRNFHKLYMFYFPNLWILLQCLKTDAKYALLYSRSYNLEF